MELPVKEQKDHLEWMEALLAGCSLMTIVTPQKKYPKQYMANNGTKFNANPLPTLFHECIDSSKELKLS
jgi:hypothetical protein